MLTLHVDAERLVRSRFALSRLTEVTNALEVLAHPERAPYARSWVTQTRRTLAPGSVDVLFALVNGAAAYIPDFLSPLPGSYQPTLDEELAAVAATTAEDVHRQLRTAFRIGPPPPVLLERSPTGRDPRPPLPATVAELLARRGEEALLTRVVDQLARFWRHTQVDLWPTLHRVLDEDIRHRATLATRTGLADIVRTLDPRLTWDGRRVTLDSPAELSLDAARGLILSPSAFLPRPAVYLGAPGLVMVGYPARGRGQVWSLPAPAGEETGILGARRAALLTDLATPLTTTELAARHGISPATVSYHLGRLRRAGLVVSRREGHEVRYERTRAAVELLRALRGDSRHG
ncbi:helix-turn-helix domain-containing protein [Micromonospora sp. NPDC000442]|uniref:ArsR/SmtB family transcription factor n=1 Tax=Micromonospora sp. NPDC000442 TaxID=3364217 RepID=UPI0036753CE7